MNAHFDMHYAWMNLVILMTRIESGDQTKT